MKVADLLSDLTQLQAADSEAALALVSTRPNASGNGATAADKALTSRDETDPDLKRAKDLLELHKTVKLAHRDAEPDSALKQARADVAKVMSDLQRHQ